MLHICSLIWDTPNKLYSFVVNRFMTREEFHNLFEKHYNQLCNYAFVILKNHDEAEDVVQGVFVDFWNRPEKDSIQASYENYLVRAVKFKCIDIQRRDLVKRKYEAEAVHLQKNQNEEYIEEDNQLGEKLKEVVDQLPEKTKEVFILCKQDGMSYKDIAAKLGISVKTVENQMGRAFRHLREGLKAYKEMVQALIIYFWIGGM